jgi:hypothetical protein
VLSRPRLRAHPFAEQPCLVLDWTWCFWKGPRFFGVIRMTQNLTWVRLWVGGTPATDARGGSEIGLHASTGLLPLSLLAGNAVWLRVFRGRGGRAGFLQGGKAGAHCPLPRLNRAVGSRIAQETRRKPVNWARLVCACLAALPRAPEPRRRHHAVHTTQIFDFNTSRRRGRARAPTSARDEWDGGKVQTLTHNTTPFSGFFFSSHRPAFHHHVASLSHAPSAVGA